MAKIPSSSEKKRRRRAKARAKANKIAEAERTENFNSSRPGLDDLSAESEDSDLFPETPAGPAQLRLRFQRRLFPEDEVPEQSELSFWAVSPAPDEPPHPLAPGSVPDSEEELALVDSEAEEEDAVMAQAEIPPAEVSVRLQIEDDLAQFKVHMDKVPPNTRQAGINSQFVETELKKLQVTTYGRIARLPAAARDANKLDWVNWKTGIIDLLDTEQVRLEHALAGGSPDQLRTNALEQEKAVIQTRINQHIQMVKDHLTSLEAAIAALQPRGAAADAAEVPKSQFINLQSRLDIAREFIRPKLVELYDQLIALDPAQHVAVNAALSGQLAALDALVDTARDNLYRLNVESAVFEPQGASTPNQSLLADSNVNVGRSGRGGSSYDHVKQAIPEFTGDPTEYPSWKAEMLGDVLPGKSHAQCLRIMAKYSPEKDLAQQFKTKEQGFQWMDDQYANPVAVAENVVDKFLTLKTLDGDTDQLKVVSLTKVLRKLHNTLEVVKQEKQLTHSIPMVNRAIKLLPQKYREEFADKVEDAESALSDDMVLSGLQKYNLLSEWLENKSRKLIQHCPDQLAKNTSRKDEPDSPQSETQQLICMVQQLQQQLNQEEGKSGKGAAGGGRGSSRHGDCMDKIPASQLPAIKEKWSKYGMCPLCKAQGHVYEGKKGWFASDSLADCKKFCDLRTVDEKAKFVMDNKVCDNCLSWSHEFKDCKKPENSWYCRVKDASGNFCRGKHSKYLHGTTIQLSI